MPSAPPCQLLDTSPPAQGQALELPHLDLHGLELHHLDGQALPARSPDHEPIVGGKPSWLLSPSFNPPLIAGPMVLICDSAGANGEVAVAVLQG